MISIQDNKINKLTKRVTNLEQILPEAESCKLIATNASELMKMDVDKLMWYLQRPCLVTSVVELPPNKAIESAVVAEEKVRRIIETNLDIRRDDSDCELDKMQRLHPNKNLSDKKNVPPKLPNIICKFRAHRFGNLLCRFSWKFENQIFL